MNSVKFIPASGTCESGLMVIGEAPGAEEDAQGKPFVGRSGKLLDKMLAFIGLNREIVYVTNIVKVRPDENRKPTLEEILSWSALLMFEVETEKPKVIMTVGNSATQAILGTEEGITKLRGKSFQVFQGAKYGCVLVPTYHPSYLLRKSGHKETNEQVKEDLKLVKSLLNVRVEQNI